MKPQVQETEETKEIAKLRWKDREKDKNKRRE
jgi:hypothetical protein